MTDHDENDNPTAVREEAQSLAMTVGAGRAVLAATGQRDEVLEEAAERLTEVITRAADQEQQALTAAMETLDPVEFGRRVRVRRRMTALRKKGGQR